MLRLGAPFSFIKRDAQGSRSPRLPEWLQNILAGLTVSFVAISLGAAFGVMSERGALAGILSAGLIALITSLFGGTRIQCSGPTAPMTAVFATVFAVASDEFLGQFGAVGTAAEVSIMRDHFFNVVLLLTGALLILCALLRLGRFITLVPTVVISGFMDGIAVLIWVGEIKKLFGLGGSPTYTGGLGMNVAVAGITLVMLFTLPKLIKSIHPRLGSFLPATLLTIGIMSAAVMGLRLEIELVDLGAGIKSFSAITDLVVAQWPSSASLHMVWVALPFALNLTLLAYLDSLLTSLVVDQKVQKMFGTDEKTAQNQELVAQGLANGLVAFIGGIPGAQATIRSVLILNENATLRLAGVLTGAFVLVEMLLFQDLVSYIPKAVFAGLLIKVGYDVMDWGPLVNWVKERRTPVEKITVPHLDLFFIVGTTVVTVVWNLNAAVLGFTALFYILRKFMPPPAEEATAAETSEGATP